MSDQQPEPILAPASVRGTALLAAALAVHGYQGHLLLHELPVAVIGLASRLEPYLRGEVTE